MSTTKIQNAAEAEHKDERENNPDVKALRKFRSCEDAWMNQDGQIYATWTHDCITGSMVGGKPQKVMLERGYAVAAVSNNSEDETTIRYKKITDF